MASGFTGQGGASTAKIDYIAARVLDADGGFDRNKGRGTASGSRGERSGAGRRREGNVDGGDSS